MSEDTPSASDKRSCYLFPKTLGHCIEPITRPILKAQGLAGSRILTQWPSVVGAALARHSYPEKLSFPKGKKTGGTLVISVENGFATELQYQQPQILERLSVYFGYQAITRITISHSWTGENKPLPAAPKKPPLTAASRELADQVEDAELREALRSFAHSLSGGDR